MNCGYHSIGDIENEISSNLSKKICVLLMSGGVDSSTCLLLLQKEGFYVIGVHYNFGKTYKTNKENKCCNLSDLNDAREICTKFGVKFFNIDYSEKFRTTIIDVFLREKSKGVHFNPCTVCHEKIKYGEVLDLIKKYNKFIASGYYCKIENGKLMRPKDEDKDQTQSLILKITKEDLKYYKFPLGTYLKSEVRKLAKDGGIKAYDKKDSMGLCFVGEKNIKDFINKNCKLSPGEIYYWDLKFEKKIGKKHKGLGLYEYGENSGLNLKIDGKPTPLYVYKKNISNNTLIVSKKELTLRDSFKSRNYNLLSENFVNLSVKYNSNLESVKCEARLNDGILEVILGEKMIGVVTGEIFLLFSGNQVVGGGVIEG